MTFLDPFVLVLVSSPSGIVATPFKFYRDLRPQALRDSPKGRLLDLPKQTQRITQTLIKLTIAGDQGLGYPIQRGSLLTNYKLTRAFFRIMKDF